MNELRLFLLVIGLLIIALIYAWGTLRSRKEQRQQTIHQSSSQQDMPEFRIANKAESDIDYSTLLSGLNQSIRQSKEIHSAEVSKNSGRTDELFETDESEENQAKPLGDTGTADRDDSDEVKNVTPEKIVVLHLIPRGNQLLYGQELLNAVEQVDLQFGQMNIFHHHGLAELQSERPLFSMANMMEPGYFDLDQIENFTTSGLVMFMTLPAPIDGQVVFELMLNTAQRLSALLGTDVCDENRSLISEQKIDSIRSQISVE